MLHEVFHVPLQSILSFNYQMTSPFDITSHSLLILLKPINFRCSSYSSNLEGRNSSEVPSLAPSTMKKSQDAAVGALVHMLKTAPPLRQESCYYNTQSSKTEFEGEIGAASEFFKPRKTSDALEELKVYRQMKDLLLSKSAAHPKTEF